MRRRIITQQKEVKRRRIMEVRDDARDAARWRALVNTMHVISSTPHPYSNIAKGARYLVVEFCSELADPALSKLPTDHLLTAYADFVRQKE